MDVFCKDKLQWYERRKAAGVYWFFCSSIKAEEWSRKVIKNEIILHASICICFSKAASHCLHLEEICIAQKIGVMGKLVLLPRLCKQSSVSGTPWFHLQCKWSLDEYHVDNEHITSPAGADFPLKKKEKKTHKNHKPTVRWRDERLLNYCFNNMCIHISQKCLS